MCPKLFFRLPPVFLRTPHLLSKFQTAACSAHGSQTMPPFHKQPALDCRASHAPPRSFLHSHAALISILLPQRVASLPIRHRIRSLEKRTAPTEPLPAWQVFARTLAPSKTPRRPMSGRTSK